MTEERNNQKKPHHLLSGCFEWVSALIAALIAVIVVFTLLFRVVTVSGDSMFDTLSDGDRLIMITQLYKLERGDIVVIQREDNEPLIKRVVALEGDTIHIDPERNIVLLNGVELTEEYIYGDITPPFEFVGPYTLQKGEVFAMGDNRQWSHDSRHEGVFHKDEIMGEAAFRLFPFYAFGRI